MNVILHPFSSDVLLTSRNSGSPPAEVSPDSSVLMDSLFRGSARQLHASRKRAKFLNTDATMMFINH